MDRLFFARFPSRPAAAKFLHDIHASGLSRRVHVGAVSAAQVQSGQSLPVSLSNLRAAILKGLLLGGAGGLILGIVLAATDVAPAGMAALCGAVFGALAGTLGAALIGASDPDANLERTVTRMGAGEVVLSFQTRDAEIEADLRNLARGVGAEVIQKTGPHLGERAGAH